jgi:hypothetical protein
VALWDDLIGEVNSLTKRPDLVTYSNLALRQAVRTAHKSGKFWRDIVSVTVNIAQDTVQELDILANTTRFRQAAYVKAGTCDIYYDPVTIDDLLDADKFVRQDIYWAFGSIIKIRACSPQDSYELAYFQYPDVNPSTFNDWIADQHRDLLTMWAAMTVLGSVGEQEIRGNLEKLALLQLADLQQDSLEIVGR